jgi:hypothetical protein
VDDAAIQAFTTEARRYCSLIEGNEFANSWMFALACLTQVLRLYEHALRLPEIEAENLNLLSRVEHEPWQRMGEHVGRRLARDYYWETFEPLEQEKPEPVVGSLSDGLADIWRDIKPGVAEIDRGKQTSISDAVWHWRSSFESHWGHHAAGAIFALHAVCFGPFADGSRAQRYPAV